MSEKKDDPVVPWSQVGPGLRMSPAARKEKLRERGTKVGHPRIARPYAELRAMSAFSFLRGASLPEDLIDRAAALDLPAVALVDVGGVSAAPRFWKAAKGAGIRPLVGAEVAIEGEPETAEAARIEAGEREKRRSRRSGRSRTPEAASGGEAPKGSSVGDPERRPRGLEAVPLRAAPPGARLSLLVENRDGYRNLCRLLTSGALGREKGSGAASWRLIEEHSTGLHVLTGGPEGPLSAALERNGGAAARKLLERLSSIFGGRVSVELQRHRLRDEEHRNRALVDLARSTRLPLVATNGVRYATAAKKELADVLSATRFGTTLDAAGRRLDANRERHFRSAAEMSELFADLPEALDGSATLARRLDFTLDDLGYRFPDFPLPSGETNDSLLSQLAWEGARSRFRPLSARAQRQIEHELKVIAKLGLAGYFLIVRDIVRFCLENRILVQGRGSAANSAVCYALSITAVDPVRMDLLFERFLSEERGEWPDIDLDLPSGDQRERVIQYVYRRYGERGAAMTANVITYRERSAAREVGKALGFSLDQCDALSKQLGSPWGERPRGDPSVLAAGVSAAGFDPGDRRVALFSRLFVEILNLPRHLGQHSGGMVMAAGRLDEVVPLEPASMPGRVIVQWDKDDCADLGIVKVDLLGLGMLAALEECVPAIRTHENLDVDLAHIPDGDSEVYRMLNEADTVGVFQLESRAQMASLPRNAPKVFYDLVVQVAIIRPGPIVGGLMQAFFDRRRGRAPVDYLHPSLEPILKRTLGVPIFQEQILRIAMTAAGFSGGEAEELRRAMGFKRSVEKMERIEERLREGMAERGITGEAQDQILKWITSFAMYGFPESHAASFALIAYASAYLRAHHGAAFLLSLLNAWPMGFYHPSTLVQDALRHGIDVRPIDVDRSGWACRWEEGAVRIGLRYVKGLRREAGERIESERRRGAFRSLADLADRCALGGADLERLAEVGALGSFGRSRRAAMWQVARVAAEPRGEPLPDGSTAAPIPLSEDADEAPLREMTPLEETLADYTGAQLTTGPHVVSHLRAQLDSEGAIPIDRLSALPDGSEVRIAGIVIVRQHPPTAKGFAFLALEDETGIVQAIVRPALFDTERPMLVATSALVVEGVLERQDGTLSVQAKGFRPLRERAVVPSHDFR